MGDVKDTASTSCSDIDFTSCTSRMTMFQKDRGDHRTGTAEDMTGPLEWRDTEREELHFIADTSLGFSDKRRHKRLSSVGPFFFLFVNSETDFQLLSIYSKVRSPRRRRSILLGLRQRQKQFGLIPALFRSHNRHLVDLLLRWEDYLLNLFPVCQQL